jgi:hypothetical protein
MKPTSVALPVLVQRGPASMTMFAKDDRREGYVSGPSGILTARGTRFRTTEVDLKAYAADLFEKRPLGRLLADAEFWLEFPRNVSVWLLPVCVLLIGPWTGLLACLAVYVTLILARSIVTAWSATSVARLIGNVGGQAVVYVAIAGWLGMVSEMGSMVICLAGFVAFRWNLVDRTLGSAIERLAFQRAPFPVADRVLRNLIIRGALRHGIVLKGMETIQGRLRAVLDPS